MGSEEGGGGSVVVVGRAEIDTRTPFRSVKEAVALFGEKVLVGEIYARKLNEVRAAASREDHGSSRLNSMAAELEETRLSLEKARKENEEMAKRFISLQSELEKTKYELKQIKAVESQKQCLDLDFEDLKFVENSKKVDIDINEFQKKRCVTFANPLSLTQVINTDLQLERQFSAPVKSMVPSKKKKKAFLPLLGGILSKKKGYQEAEPAKTRVSWTTNI